MVLADHWRSKKMNLTISRRDLRKNILVSKYSIYYYFTIYPDHLFQSVPNMFHI